MIVPEVLVTSTIIISEKLQLHFFAYSYILKIRMPVKNHQEETDEIGC